MKYIPILFSSLMVQANRQDRKTQTRRIIKPQPDDNGLWNHTDLPISLDSDLNGWCGTVYDTGESKEFKCKFGQAGDILWVRETFASTVNVNSDTNWPNRPHIALEMRDDEKLWTAYIWAADGNWQWCDDDGFNTDKSYWKPSIHMPKEACRLFLKVKSVRVERLQDISAIDCLAEGVGEKFRSGAKSMTSAAIDYETWENRQKELYKSLWESINGAASWDANPWVWVVEYEKTERPTDWPNICMQTCESCQE